MRFSAAWALLLCAWANHAAADLYRWVDPETGSVKFSSYPPPWFGDPAKERRAPKVEQIPAGRPAAASKVAAPDAKAPPKPLPEAGAEPQAPAKSALEDRRKLLLKRIATLAANLAAAKFEEGGRIYADLAERVRDYNSAEQFLAQVDGGGEDARRAQWNELVAGVEGRRGTMMERLSAVPLPAEGSPPQGVRDAWQELSRQMASFGLLDNALKLLDPKGASARDADLALLTEKIAQQWKPLLGAIQRPPAQ